MLKAIDIKSDNRVNRSLGSCNYKANQVISPAIDSNLEFISMHRSVKSDDIEYMKTEIEKG